MKRLLSLALLTAATVLYSGSALQAADTEGVALAIVYDSSGSMRDTVRDVQGRETRKYLIANRALATLATQIEKYATNNASGPRQVQAALFTFKDENAREAMPMSAFDADRFRDWAKRFSNPSGNTPLGRSLNVAWEAVSRSPLSRKHVLVITDGMNTAGPKPNEVLPGLKQKAAQQGKAVSVHFVAFDVDAKLFDPLKKQGVTVVSAADENQLNAQLDYILQKKILLEDEEPARKP